MQHIQTDIFILGAGPGGATAALFLAKENIPCILVDKAKFPRDKICGDALSGKVVEILNRYDTAFIEKLSKDSIQINCWGVEFVAPNLDSLKIPFKLDYAKKSKERERAPGFISKRIEFDHFLIQEVKKHPSIQCLEEIEIEKIEKTENGFLLFTKNNEIQFNAKLIIDASGAQSQFAQEYGNIHVEREHYCAGIRAYYENVSGMKEGNFIELHFLKDFLPGYFWIFPLPNGEANVGLGMRSDYVSKKKIDLKKKLLEVIEQYPQLKERFKDAKPIDKIRGYGLPLGSKKRKISGDHFMLIGDAASLIDPFTGEGIGNAVLSGMTAAMHAKKCREQNNYSSAAMQEYDTIIYRRLWDELSLSYKMQRLVNYKWLFNFVVRKANRNKVLRDTISVMFEDVDLREQFRKPSFYFKLLFSK